MRGCGRLWMHRTDFSRLSWKRTGSQWSCWAAGVMWWEAGLLVMIRASEFCTQWELTTRKGKWRGCGREEQLAWGEVRSRGRRPLMWWNVANLTVGALGKWICAPQSQRLWRNLKTKEVPSCSIWFLCSLISRTKLRLLWIDLPFDSPGCVSAVTFGIARWRRPVKMSLSRL